MKRPKVAMAYAKALFQFAKIHGLLEEISQQFEWFMKIWGNEQLLRDFFACHAIGKDEKISKLESLFNEYLHPAFLNFFRRIIRRGHCGTLPYMYQHFQKFLDRHYDKHYVQIISPFPIEDRYYHQFYHFLQQSLSQNIVLTPVIDPEVLGGFIISSDTFRIDCSIRHELEFLQRRFYSLADRGVSY